MTPLPTEQSEALYHRAQQVIPGGVSSPVRAFRAVGGTPRFIRSARGAYVTDVDGNEYVDLVGSWGPMLLGHAHPEVLDAVARAAQHGTSFGAPTEAEIDLAQMIIDRTPVEQVRLVNSGTEATMSALRLARGYTGRPKVIKFEGCYHGHVDSLLVAAGSGAATMGHPSSPGVTAATTADTIVCAYNDRASVEQAFARHGNQIACIITEAAAGNMGVVPPAVEDGENFTAFLARIAHAHGALLITDEVMTGFRVSRSGQWGLDGQHGDLMTFGKVMGGGFPAAAFGGRAEVMAHLAPDGPVYQAGTLSGNPVATAAGLATLRACTPSLYDHLGRVADTISTAASEALAAEGVAHTVQRAASMFSIFFTDGPVRSYADAQQQDTAAFGRFFHAMLDGGVHLPPSAYEAWFVGAAHDEAAVDAVLGALPAAARAAAQP